jgi:replicative DNA helicase
MNLFRAYVVGIAKCKGFPFKDRLQPGAITDPSNNEIHDLFMKMGKLDSTFVAEVVHNELASLIGEHKARKFMAEVEESEMQIRQLREIHNKLQNAWVQREARKTLEQLQGALHKEDILDEALEYLRQLKALQPSKAAVLRDQTDEALEFALDAQRGLIPFGIPKLDRAIGGLPRQEVSVIAGRPGHGKTSFSCQLVLNWIKAGHKVVIFSKEMPATRLLHKFLSNASEISSEKIFKGFLDDAEKKALGDASAMFTKTFEEQLFIYDDVYSVKEMETIIAKIQPDIVVDDFIQLSEMDNANLRMEIGRYMKTYKAIAKEYNLALVTLSQLNRSIEYREDPKPRLSDLAESGSIEQLAGVVLFVYYAHKVDYDAPSNRVEIIASKTRYGTTCLANLAFNGDFMRYYQIPQLSRAG